MNKFEISEATLNRLNDLVAQNPENQVSSLADYCKCTGFGG